MDQSAFTSPVGHYIWDLGFDISAVQKPNTLSYLQSGLVAMGTQVGNVPTTPAVLAKGNKLAFNLFDVTSHTIASGYKPIAAKVTFSSAQTGQTASNPFGSTIMLAGGPTTPVTADGSTVIHIGLNNFASGFKGRSAIFGPNTDFSGWTLIHLQEILHPGHFLFTVAVIVQAPDGRTQRTFVVDPEMIFGGTDVPP